MIYGATPIDLLMECLLSGGQSITAVNAQFLAGGRLYIVHSYFTVLSSFFKSYLGLLLSSCIPTLREVFVHDNMKFLAPLSWMIVAYISIYMTRRVQSDVSYSSKRHPHISKLKSSRQHGHLRTSKARNRHQRKFYRSPPPKPSAPPSDHMLHTIFCKHYRKKQPHPVSLNPVKRNKSKVRYQASAWTATHCSTCSTYLSIYNYLLSSIKWFTSFICALPSFIWTYLFFKSSTTPEQAYSNIDENVVFSRHPSHSSSCDSTSEPVSYTHLTLPTICSV